jgi:hypothetical protein
MRAPRAAYFVIPVFAVIALGASPFGAARQDSKDPFPNGCVSCHAKVSDGDHRLQAMLAKKKHASLANVVNVPGDCMKCHKSKSPTFGQSVHKQHFGRGSASAFVEKFKGDCSHCHRVDPKTGKATFKSGKKNWYRQSSGALPDRPIDFGP